MEKNLGALQHLQAPNYLSTALQYSMISIISLYWFTET